MSLIVCGIAEGLPRLRRCVSLFRGLVPWYGLDSGPSEKEELSSELYLRRRFQDRSIMIIYVFGVYGP